MFSLPNGKMTIGQVLFPVSIVAFVMFLMLGFQLTQIMRDRDAMHQAREQQDKPLDEAKKVQNQLTALAVGTKKLSDKGDVNAKGIIDRMKKIGITVSDNPPGATAAPGASMTGASPANGAAPSGIVPASVPASAPSSAPEAP